MVLKCDLFAIESVLYMDIRTTRNCSSREFKLKPLSTWVDQVVVCGVKNGILRSDWDYSKVLDFILWATSWCSDQYPQTINIKFIVRN